MEEPSVESAWTIRKMSSTLSWLHSETDIKTALISSVRRVLCYPLYRHWVLAMKVSMIVALYLGLSGSIKPLYLKCTRPLSSDLTSVSYIKFFLRLLWLHELIHGLLVRDAHAIVHHL